MSRRENFLEKMSRDLYSYYGVTEKDIKKIIYINKNIQNYINAMDTDMPKIISVLNTLKILYKKKKRQRK